MTSSAVSRLLACPWREEPSCEPILFKSRPIRSRRRATTEALELGCTCQVIAHEVADQEREPAGIMIDPDPNCPLHGTNRDVSASASM